MKKNSFKIGIILCFINIFIFYSIILTASTNSFLKHNKETQVQDTSYIVIKGKVIDKETNAPLVFVNIFLKGTNIATVSNSEGEFILKIPQEKKNLKIEFFYIGYKNRAIFIKNLIDENIIRLESASIPLTGIQIRPEYPAFPRELVKKALAKIPKNYSERPNLLTGFYRETVKKNWYYVAVSEGVINVYKSPYNKLSDDYIKLIKGRKSIDVKRMDTINFKLRGGPYSTLLMDIVKNPDVLFPTKFLDSYDFKFTNIIQINDRANYVIEFNQFPVDNRLVYNGKIYIDIETLAFSAIEFSLKPEFSKRATSLLVLRKPLLMKASLESGNYYVNYKENNGKWYLNYARGEVVFKFKWKRRFFKSKYTTISELAITNRMEKNVTKFSRKELLSPRNVFVDKASYFLNSDSFWGDYNYIKPDETIESAIKKLNKKFRKN